jgi:CheY-like chemotaxis protein
MAHTFKPRCDVVLVDDNPDDQLCFQRAAERTGTPFQIRAFFSGPAFAYVEYLRGEQQAHDQSPGPRPAFVLCDYDLRPIKGSRFVNAIRAALSCKELMIVMFCASDPQRIVNSSYGSGADHFLRKPATQQGFDLLARTLYTAATSGPGGFHCLNRLQGYRPCPESLLGVGVSA